MIREAFADLLFVSGNGVGTGCGVVVRVEFVAGTNDDVGEWGVFANMFKDRDGRFVMWNGCELERILKVTEESPVSVPPASPAACPR